MTLENFIVAHVFEGDRQFYSSEGHPSARRMLTSAEGRLNLVLQIYSHFQETIDDVTLKSLEDNKNLNYLVSKMCGAAGRTALDYLCYLAAELGMAGFKGDEESGDGKKWKN